MLRVYHINSPNPEQNCQKLSGCPDLTQQMNLDEVVSVKGELVDLTRILPNWLVIVLEKDTKRRSRTTESIYVA